MSSIEFWFDFASPYAYFAALQVDDLAARYAHTVIWRPFLLGSAFKLTGAQALTLTPMKGDYARLDCMRIAKLLDVPFVLPSMPSVALPATRVFYLLESRSPACATTFAKAIFRAYFGGQVDCGEVDAVVALAAELGHDEAAVRTGIADPTIKGRAIAISREGLSRGVFGSPWVFVGDEPFWGWDRLPMVERRIAALSAECAMEHRS